MAETLHFSAGNATRTGSLGLVLVSLVATAGCSAPSPPAPPRGYTIVAEYPHDTTAYTQGFVHAGGSTFWESTGQYGRSELRTIDLGTGPAIRKVPLPSERFGEGLALHDGVLVQLTWQSGIAYRYDTTGLRLLDSTRYAGEGWGLTSDGSSLVMSNGSDTLRFVDPRTFAVRRELPVRFSSGAPVTKLNELEWSRGEIFANVYQSDWIVRIDSTGLIREILDLSGLLPGHEAGPGSDEVLNGIAVDERSGHLFVTGKRWPTIYELRLDRSPGSTVSSAPATLDGAASRR